MFPIIPKKLQEKSSNEKRIKHIITLITDYYIKERLHYPLFHFNKFHSIQFYAFFISTSNADEGKTEARKNNMSKKSTFTSGKHFNHLQKKFFLRRRLKIWTQILLSFLICSCQSKPSQTESIISYIAQLDSNINVRKVLISDKYISTVDSTEIRNLLSNNNDTDVNSMTKKLQLIVGSNVYFSLNPGDITEHQIDNIIKNSKRYENLNLTPESYCIFSIISHTDEFGDTNNTSIAFLFNKKDSIENAKFVEPCTLFLELFDKKDIDRLIKNAS